MAAKIVNPSFPEINHDLRFLLAHYPAAYEIDRTPGTNAIRQPLDNLNEAGSLYGAIIYQKAPIVMRQLEGILGETALRDGLQQYLRAHRFANATWSDLIALLDERTPEDLAAWSRAWVEEAGRPIVTTDLRVDNGRIASLSFVQRDPVRAAQASSGISGSRSRSACPTACARCRCESPRRAWRFPTRAACRRRDSSCPRAAASATQDSSSMPPASTTCLTHLPDDRRSAHARGRLDHALGTDARSTGAGLGDRRSRAARVAARDRRTERAADPRLCATGVLDVSLPAADRRRVCAAARAGAARPASAAAPTQSLKSAWFSALRDVAQSSRHGRLARAGVEKDGERARPDAGRTGLHHARAGAGGAGAAQWKPSSTSSWRASRTRTARRGSRTCGPRCQPTRGCRDTFFERLHEVGVPAARGRGCSKA